MSRPLWRWVLFCLAVRLHFAFGWAWTLELLAWCVLPEWLGHEEAR